MSVSGSEEGPAMTMATGGGGGNQLTETNSGHSGRGGDGAAAGTRGEVEEEMVAGTRWRRATAAKGDGGEGRRRRRATAAKGDGGEGQRRWEGQYPKQLAQCSSYIPVPVPPKGDHVLLILNNCG